jgi:hypothetical protein
MSGPPVSPSFFLLQFTERHHRLGESQHEGASSIAIIVMTMVMAMPLAMAIVVSVTIPVANNSWRPIVSRRGVVPGPVLRWYVIHRRRRHISRWRGNHNHSRQSDSDGDGPVVGLRAGRKHRCCKTQADRSAE